MISKNDLYDINSSLILIRNNIRYKFNIAILDKIIQVLMCNGQDFEDNQVRKAIASISNLDQELWYYVYHNNIYTNHKLLKNSQIYKLLITICNTLKELLEVQEFDKAYDLVDSVHCLPEIIAENNFSIPKSYWKSFIKSYRKKWDKTFLVQEQKLLK